MLIEAAAPHYLRGMGNALWLQFSSQHWSVHSREEAPRN